MTTPRALGFSVLVLLASACRPREGERCICADDCAGDLVCAADGAELSGNQCVNDVSNDLESGVCVQGGNANSDEDALTPPPKLDAGSWATSGQAPVTTAGDESDSTTMAEGTSVGGESSSSSSGGGSSGAEETSGSSSSSSSSSDGTGASSGDTTDA